jgi:hypothetical protein
MSFDWKTYGCRSTTGEFHLIGGEDLEDVMRSYANVFPYKELESVYLLVYQKEYENE